jgi:hypothetical protein
MDGRGRWQGRPRQQGETVRTLGVVLGQGARAEEDLLSSHIYWECGPIIFFNVTNWQLDCERPVP